MNVLSVRCQENNKVKPTLLYEGYLRCTADPYHPTDNKSGIINMGTSENTMCDDLVIPKLQSLTEITPPELRYFCLNGMLPLREDVARFLTDKTKSDQQIDPDELSITNGCSSAFCSLAYMIGEPGDYYLIPTPYYGMTEVYMGNYMQLKPIGVETDSNNMVSVRLLAEAWERAVEEGKKVCGVVLINPSNPTGAVYSKELQLEVFKFAKERKLHVIIDEIYFLSTFEEDKFQSCLSFSREWPDPARTHFMWGFSKDFSMSGSRSAVIHSKNKGVHQAFGKDIGFYHNVPGMVQMKLCRMLRDTEWVDEYLRESRVRLRRHAQIVMTTLDQLNLSYVTPTGTLYLWMDFTPLFRGPPSPEEAAEIFYQMIDSGIYIPSSKGFNGTDPAFFRIIYAIPEGFLAEAMTRLKNFVIEYTAS